MPDFDTQFQSKFDREPAASDKQQSFASALRTVVKASHELLNSNTLDELWRRAVELAREHLDVERCSIFLLQNAGLVGTFGTNLQRQTTDERGVHLPLDPSAQAFDRQFLAQGSPQWFVTEDMPLVEIIDNVVHLLSNGWSVTTAIRSQTGTAVGFFFNDTAITHTPRDPLQQELLGVYCTLLGNIAERKMLEQRLTRRTRELSKLLDISQTIQSTLELKPLFRRILEQMREVIEFDVAHIYERLENYDLQLTESLNAPDEQLERVWPYHPDDTHIARMFETRQPTLIPDMTADSPEAHAFRQRLFRITKSSNPVGSVMQVPLVVRDEVIGMLSIRSFGAKTYSEEDSALALAFANQAATALHIARLHAEAIASTARSERQRLAQELHDSVSQALFGMVMGAHTAMRLLPEASPATLSVNYVLDLAHIAQAEMRALLLEMRPDALQTEGLRIVLKHQVDALAARHKIAITQNLGTQEPQLALQDKEMLYRVCIEALNNALRHAHPSQIEIRLAEDMTETLLEVKDNGTGFDTSLDFPGHFGLKGMRERAEKAGAIFQLKSAPGAGTALSVRIKHAAMPG